MKILVVDDHPLVQQALAQLFRELDHPAAIVAAGNREQAYAMLAAHPDCALVLLDLALPGSRGFALLASLHRDFPRLPIAVLSATHDRPTVEGALAAGARGFIAKTASARQLVEAVERLLAGRACPPPELARAQSPGASARGPDGEFAPGVLGLTQRQADVLCLMAQGKPNKLICRDLRLSEGTVKVHVSAILRHFNVKTRTQAIVELARRGIPVEALARQ